MLTRNGSTQGTKSERKIFGTPDGNGIGFDFGFCALAQQLNNSDTFWPTGVFSKNCLHFEIGFGNSL